MVSTKTYKAVLGLFFVKSFTVTICCNCTACVCFPVVIKTSVIWLLGVFLKKTEAVVIGWGWSHWPKSQSSTRSWCGHRPRCFKRHMLGLRACREYVLVEVWRCAHLFYGSHATARSAVNFVILLTLDGPMDRLTLLWIIRWGIICDALTFHLPPSAGWHFWVKYFKLIDGLQWNLVKAFTFPEGWV